MNIRQIQSFLAVADTKSFSEASKLMYTSVSQISKLVKGLEEELGQVFFERKKNGVVLTHEGMKIYNIANKILRDIDELEFIKERRGKESFTVLGLPDLCMDDIFIQYMNERKDLDRFYNLSYKTIDAISQEMHVRKADLGFAYIDRIRLTAIQMRLKDYALTFTPLAEAQKYLFIRKDHPLARNGSVQMKQLEAFDQVRIKGTDYLNSEFKKGDAINAYSTPAIRMITHNLSTALNVVSRTDLVYTGCDIFDQASDMENVRRIPIESEGEGSEFGFIRKYTIELSETAKEFLFYVEEDLLKRQLIS